MITLIKPKIYCEFKEYFMKITFNKKNSHEFEEIKYITFINKVYI